MAAAMNVWDNLPSYDEDRKWNRNYVQIKPTEGSDILTNLPNAHITVLEYYLATGNWDGSRKLLHPYNVGVDGNSESNVINRYIASNLAPFLNDIGVEFHADYPIKMGASNFFGAKMNMRSKNPDYDFSDLIDESIKVMHNYFIREGLKQHNSTNRIRNLKPQLMTIPKGGLKFGDKKSNDQRIFGIMYKSGDLPVAFIKLYSPVIPHISMESASNFARGIDGWSASNGKIVGGSDNKQKYLELKHNPSL